MLLPILCALLLARPSGESDDFGEHLARLAAPLAAERAAAERWLQAHLVLARYPELAEAALAGDAEVRARLARVLSSDPRHLGLALALCAEADASLAALGRDSVRAGIARAAPRLGEAPVREGIESLLARAAAQSPPTALRLAANRPLGELLEELTLAFDLPLGLTLDARVASSLPRREERPASATWNELLMRLASGLGLALECHGWPRGRTLEMPSGVFLRFAPRGEPARNGVELVSDWLIVLALPGEESARVRAAKNLASSGFAPGLAWMEERVRTRADGAAREGLLWAAAHGRVAPVLLAAEVLDPLLVEAEAGGARSGRILAALARAGCFGGAESSLAPRLMADFEGASARARWIRLFLLEQNGCGAPELEGRLHALLADGATPAALRLQALYTLASLGPAGAAPPMTGLAVSSLAVSGLAESGLAELYRLGLDDRELERLGRVLAACRLEPPFGDPARIPPEWGAAERRALLQTWLWQGRGEQVAAHVAAWLQGEPAQLPARGEALARELRAWLPRGAGPELLRALARARELAPQLAVELERVRLLLGLVPAAEVPALLERRGFSLAKPRADRALLAALGGYPLDLSLAVAAREALLAWLGAALRENPAGEDTAALLASIEGAVQSLHATGRDEVADTFASSVRQLLLRAKNTSIRRDEAQSWPPPPHLEVREVTRAAARFQVPDSL